MADKRRTFAIVNKKFANRELTPPEPLKPFAFEERLGLA
jgi:hypothetical protein